MKKLIGKMKSIFAPAVLMTVVAILALVTPLAGIASAISISAASLNDATALYTIGNLPAQHAKVGDAVANPTAGSATVELWHAGIEFTGSTYTEVGKYEYRFISGGQVFNTHTVTVTQSEYEMVMPTIMPTVAPKDVNTLTLAFPDSVKLDGEVIKDAADEDKNFKDLMADGYELEVIATMGGKRLTAADIEKTADDVKIKNISTPGTLRVTYILKKAGVTLTAKTLADIEIKNVDKGDVTFESNPSAPSVYSLDDSYYNAVELTAPTAPSAMVDETSSFSVEATTTVVAYKYSATEPDDWDDISEVAYVDGNDTIVADGLEITTKKTGFYRLKFQTTTLFGYVTENEDDTDGMYWSDTFEVEQDTVAPTFDWVVNGETLDSNESAPYLPATTEPTDTDKIVTIANGIVFPAISAEDNHTATEDLTYTITVRQEADLSGNDITSGITDTLTSEGDEGYNPAETLSVSFTTETSQTANNLIGMKDGEKEINGLYQITFTVNDKAVEGGWSKSISKTFYFKVDTAHTDVAPTIDSFYVSDVYKAQGNTFEFIPASYEDEQTSTLKLKMDYYMVNEAGQVAKLDSAIVDGKIKVDLSELKDQDGATLIFTSGAARIYAVARNFNAMQVELNTSNPYVSYEFPVGSGSDFDRYPVQDAVENSLTGARYKYAEFTIYDATSSAIASAFAVTYEGGVPTAKAGEEIKFTNIAFDWAANTDSVVSVAVYKADDRTPVNVYNENDEVVSSVVMNKASANITFAENWYFIPGSAGEYQLVITVKQNASSNVYTYVDDFTVAAGDGFDIRPYSVSTMSTSDATISVGDIYVLPEWKIDANGEELVSKNRKLYRTSNDTVYGDYTVTVKGVNDPNAVVGNKFVPNYSGTYKFEYNFYQNGSTTIQGTIEHIVTVSESSSESGSIKMNEAYGEIVDGKLVKDPTDTTNAPNYAITLDEFMFANTQGTHDFIIDQTKLKENLEETTAGSGKYMYPAIAIPMPNVISGSFDTDDVEITVQRSGETDYLVSSKEEDVADQSEIGQLGGYWTFRPEGEFTSNGDDFLQDAVNKNEASGVYIVTYKLPDGKTAVYNLTIGNPEVGELNFADDVFSYEDLDGNMVDINAENNEPIIDENEDGLRIVYIDMKKVTYNNANTDFQALIEKGIDGTVLPTAEDRAEEYIYEKATVTVYYEGTTIAYTSDLKDSEYSNEADKIYAFELKGSGTYKISISLYNPYTNNSAAMQTFEFTIDTTATNAETDLSTVWGIILIILSIGLLAGVIFYFIKTGKETKFMQEPKMPRSVKSKVSASKKEEKTKNTENKG